ncbi:MAG TPA: alpha/beta hydrolase [Streptosporangiaceae bacterium]|nr:alpha/beta hydrolase [Streptosporangiaceae bacterium]
MRYLTVSNSVDLYYEDAGEGPPVVLIHSWGTSARMWNAQLVDLTSDHRVVTYDWRGCGRSSRPVTGNSIAQNSQDLLELCTALQLRSPVLVGHSVGAIFAIEAALSDPAFVAGVVAIDGPGHWGNAMAHRLPAIRTALDADRAATVAAWVPDWYGPAIGDATQAWTTRQIVDSSPYIDRLFDDQASYDPRPALAGQHVPIRYLHGSLDTQVPLDVPRQLVSITAGRDDLVIIDNAGHMPHQEQPGLVSNEIRSFVAKLHRSVP